MSLNVVLLALAGLILVVIVAVGIAVGRPGAFASEERYSSTRKGATQQR